MRGALWTLLAVAVVFVAAVIIFGDVPRWPIQPIPH